MLPAINSTVTLTFKNESPTLSLFPGPEVVELTGKVVPLPAWVNATGHFALLVANTPVPLRIINAQDVIAINGAKVPLTMPALPTGPATLTVTVTGSKGDAYTVTHEGGRWACTCVGFSFRKHCKHIQSVKK